MFMQGQTNGDNFTETKTPFFTLTDAYLHAVKVAGRAKKFP